MREMIQSSQNLLLEAKEVKMDNFKVRAQTQFSRTQLGSRQGFVLLIKMFRLIPNLGIFMITLHRTPRGRKALDYGLNLRSFIVPLLRNFSKTRSIDRRLGKIFAVILHIMSSECSADKCTTVRFIPLVKNENPVSLTKHSTNMHTPMI